MSPEQEAAYAEHLAELDRELKEHLDAWRVRPVMPYASAIPAERNLEPSNDAGPLRTVSQQITD